MSRVQLALNVADLDASIEFYTRLFQTPPAKIRENYANFAIAEPPLKLVLIRRSGRARSLNHVGVEVELDRRGRGGRRRAMQAEGCGMRRTGDRRRVASRCRTRSGSRARRSRGRSTPCSPTPRHAPGRRRMLHSD